jgi:hypothetical protein
VPGTPMRQAAHVQGAPKGAVLLAVVAASAVGVAFARSAVGPCGPGQPMPKAGILHHRPKEIEALAWQRLSLSKADWRLAWVCLAAAPVPTWVVSFFGRGNTPPTFHWTISIEDASGKVETLLGH